MITKKFIKLLSNEVSLVGSYLNNYLWDINLVAVNGDKKQTVESIGDLPGRDIMVLGGFTATRYVDPNLNRYYTVKDQTTGKVVYSDSLT